MHSFYVHCHLLRRSQEDRRDLIHFASTYGQMQMQTMKELSVPFAVLSEEGQLLWGNDEFVRVAVNKKAARRNIANVFPEISENSLPGGRRQESNTHTRWR